MASFRGGLSWGSTSKKTISLIIYQLGGVEILLRPAYWTCLPFLFVGTATAALRGSINQPKQQSHFYRINTCDQRDLLVTHPYQSNQMKKGERLKGSIASIPKGNKQRIGKQKQLLVRFLDLTASQFLEIHHFSQFIYVNPKQNNSWNLGSADHCEGTKGKPRAWAWGGGGDRRDYLI